MRANQSFIFFFLYTTSEEKEYYEALFLSYRPRTKCSISQFFKTNCIHSIFRTIEARVDFKLAKPFKKFPKSPIRPAGSNFWQVPNLRRNFKRVTLRRDKEFIESIFLTVLWRCVILKSVLYAWHFEYSCKRCLWTAENKRESDENYTIETTKNQ